MPAPRPASGGEVLGTLEIHANDELKFDPNTVDVAAPGLYEVTFVNDGAILHDLTFANEPVQSADPGQTVTFEVTIPAGGATFLCSVPGHADAGMTGTVTVAGAASGSDDHGGPVPATTWPQTRAPRPTSSIRPRPRPAWTAPPMTWS
jgi:nitrite reductase (NO-forming)